MNVITKAERARLEWLAKNVTSIHMHGFPFPVESLEYVTEREKAENTCVSCIKQRERGLLTGEEAISLICRLAG